jgi:hypothetical protein
MSITSWIRLITGVTARTTVGSGGRAVRTDDNGYIQTLSPSNADPGAPVATEGSQNVTIRGSHPTDANLEVPIRGGSFEPLTVAEATGGAAGVRNTVTAAAQAVDMSVTGAAVVHITTTVLTWVRTSENAIGVPSITVPNGTLLVPNTVYEYAFGVDTAYETRVTNGSFIEFIRDTSESSNGLIFVSAAG